MNICLTDTAREELLADNEHVHELSASWIRVFRIYLMLVSSYLCRFLYKARVLRDKGQVLFRWAECHHNATSRYGGLALACLGSSEMFCYFKRLEWNWM